MLFQQNSQLSNFLSRLSSTTVCWAALGSAARQARKYMYRLLLLGWLWMASNHVRMLLYCLNLLARSQGGCLFALPHLFEILAHLSLRNMVCGVKASTFSWSEQARQGCGGLEVLLADLFAMGRKLLRLPITHITCDSFFFSLAYYLPPYCALNHHMCCKGLVQKSGWDHQTCFWNLKDVQLGHLSPSCKMQRHRSCLYQEHLWY